jgi:major membrane immunogen (membrane-anchored lipoprotein)
MTVVLFLRLYFIHWQSGKLKNNYMKRSWRIVSISAIAIAIVMLVIGFKIKQAQPGIFKDGTYKGRSRASYTAEPFYGFVEIKVENGWMKQIDFKITDTTKNEIFDSAYEKHFTGNDEYIQQCRKDWNGVKTYPKNLLKKQDVEKLDAISGATWSYRIFSCSVKEALKNAKR